MFKRLTVGEGAGIAGQGPQSLNPISSVAGHGAGLEYPVGYRALGVADVQF